mgnify:CR=1 FL=1
MPRKQNPGPEYWKNKWQYQKATGENADDAKRAKARRIYDKAGIDRTGKDIDHKKALAAGGSAGRSNLRLRDKKANQADNGHNPGEKAGKKFRG